MIYVDLPPVAAPLRIARPVFREQCQPPRPSRPPSRCPVLERVLVQGYVQDTVPNRVPLPSAFPNPFTRFACVSCFGLLLAAGYQVCGCGVIVRHAVCAWGSAGIADVDVPALHRVTKLM